MSGRNLTKSVSCLLLILALSLSTGHSASAAEPVKKLTDVTYTYNKMPLSNSKDQGDAGLTKLVNGKLEGSDTGMLWDKMHMGTIVINFDLKGRYMIRKVIGKGHRGGPYRGYEENDKEQGGETAHTDRSHRHSWWWTEDGKSSVFRAPSSNPEDGFGASLMADD